MAATAIPHSDVHLALMAEDGAMRLAYCALRTERIVVELEADGTFAADTEVVAVEPVS